MESRTGRRIWKRRSAGVRGRDSEVVKASIEMTKEKMGFHVAAVLQSRRDYEARVAALKAFGSNDRARLGQRIGWLSMFNSSTAVVVQSWVQSGRLTV